MGFFSLFFLTNSRLSWKVHRHLLTNQEQELDSGTVEIGFVIVSTINTTVFHVVLGVWYSMNAEV